MTMLPRACRNLSVLAQCAFWLVMIVWLAGALPWFPAQENCLAAAEEKPATSQPAATPQASNNASKHLLEEFQRAYALPDDKIIKRVPPPFSPGRMEYYRVHDSEQAKYIPKGPDHMWFHWGNDKPGVLNPYREGKLTLGGMFGDGQGRQSVASLVGSFTGIRSYEIQGDRMLKWTYIPGDWVLRDGVPPEKVLQALEALLREECKIPVRFRLTERDRQIIVAEGKYAYRPLPGRSTVTEDHMYAYEGNNLQDYDQLEIFEHDRNGLRDVRSGNLAELLSFLTRNIDRPVIDGGIEVPADMKSRIPSRREHLLEWRAGEMRLREALEEEKLDEAAILKHLSEQTGLTFSEKTRRVRVLLIERAE